MSYFKQVIPQTLKEIVTLGGIIAFLFGFSLTKLANALFDFIHRQFRYYSLGRTLAHAQNIIEKDKQIDKAYKAYKKLTPPRKK